MRSQNLEYIAGVDHVRAFASLLVVFHHSFWLIHRKWEPPGLTNETWFSTDNPLFSPIIETHIVVSLFFVLSGFMFSLAGADRKIRYGPFLRNRALFSAADLQGLAVELARERVQRPHDVADGPVAVVAGVRRLGAVGELEDARAAFERDTMITSLYGILDPRTREAR